MMHSVLHADTNAVTEESHVITYLNHHNLRTAMANVCLPLYIHMDINTYIPLCMSTNVHTYL